MSASSLAGFLNINKPLHLTSHDVVARLRRRYRDLTGGKKVGHAGTLDPLATGVLVICLGAATRLSQYMMRSRKVYQARLQLGLSTTTFDAAGDTVSQSDASHIERADIEAALPAFIGEIAQIPPMHSAVKIGGKKLYELARAGQTIERAARPVTIDAIDILHWGNPALELEIRCGPGTYIRSLAHDLGEALGVGASLTALTRRASGNFCLADSIALETVLRDEGWPRHIIPPYAALSQRPRLTLSAEEIARVRQGGFIHRRADTEAAEVFAFDAHKRLVAILRPRANMWKPHKVFPR